LLMTQEVGEGGAENIIGHRSEWRVTGVKLKEGGGVTRAWEKWR